MVNVIESEMKMYEMPPSEKAKFSMKVPLKRVIFANMKKEVQIQLRYKANFIAGIVQALLFILIFWFFSVALLYTNPALATTEAKFLFFLSAFVIVFYDGVFLYGAVNTVNRDLYNGTLENHSNWCFYKTILIHNPLRYWPGWEKLIYLFYRQTFFLASFYYRFQNK